MEYNAFGLTEWLTFNRAGFMHEKGGLYHKIGSTSSTETIPPRSGKLALMMDGDQCGAKAQEAFDSAKREPTAWAQAEWTAENWFRLGAMADYQDQNQRGWQTLHLD